MYIFKSLRHLFSFACLVLALQVSQAQETKATACQAEFQVLTYKSSGHQYHFGILLDQFPDTLEKAYFLNQLFQIPFVSILKSDIYANVLFFDSDKRNSRKHIIDQVKGCAYNTCQYCSRLDQAARMRWMVELNKFTQKQAQDEQ